MWFAHLGGTILAKIVVVGSLNMDVVAFAARIPVPGETIFGHSFFTAPGGKGANQAYACARLEGSTAMLGRVGDDEFGRRLCENLRLTGCDVSGILPVEGSSGVALIFVADSGQNSIVVVPGANAKFLAEHIAGSADSFLGVQIVLLQFGNSTGNSFSGGAGGQECERESDSRSSAGRSKVRGAVSFCGHTDSE